MLSTEKIIIQLPFVGVTLLMLFKMNTLFAEIRDKELPLSSHFIIASS